MRIVFATDLHGSELCFRKFINSAEFYKADVLILGGDIVGKAICAIVDEGASYRSNLFGQEHMLDSEEALLEFEEKVRFNGFYPYCCTPDELARMDEDSAYVQQVFTKAMLQSKHQWVQWADERLERYGVECYAISGNDDPYEVDEAFRDSSHMHLINGSLSKSANGNSVDTRAQTAPRGTARAKRMRKTSPLIWHSFAILPRLCLTG
jgi:uncharacterized protein